MSQFVHLHLHTQYSLLDGCTRLGPLVEQAKRFGMPAVAMTDHGNLFGAIEFYQAAQKAGVKPIIGCEAYLAPKSRFDKNVHGVHEDDYGQERSANPYYHLILLAENETGYKNLMKLVSIAHLEGFYHKPRIDKEVLQQHSAGLIGLSGCLRGEIPYLLNRGLEKEAVEAAHTYQDIFGKDRFFIEIQDNGMELQKAANRQLVQLASREGIPPVATNDCHYLHQGDAHAHDIMLCLQTGKTVNMPNRMRFETQQLYFKSPDEMIRGLGEVPEAITNTLRIAERVDLRLKLGEVHLPHYAPPSGITREAYLESLARQGLSRRMERMPGAVSPSLYEERLSMELRVINAMGYAGYFLIVWDIINYARSSQIPVGPGRGSAAGSLVAYALAITDIDPIAYGLIFERFLNPERITLPDIDMDFCMDRRDEVIRYVTQKFGRDHVGQIITFGTMAAKAAVRDVGRVLEIPYAEVDRLAKLIPNTLNITLDEALAQEPRLGQAAQADPKVADLMMLAKQLEGLARHASTHAAGVVISADPLTEHVPLYRGSKGEIITQYAMGDIERIGLVKFDFLGLRTLTVIDHAVRLVNAAALDLPTLPLDDAKTYTFLGSGETDGIFQLESAGMQDLLVKMQPTAFEDLIAILALYRPGPIGSGMVDDFIKRKRGQTKIRYELPQLEEILSETYGVIVYQEQVMKIASVLAGFSLGEADLLRRAMGKKKPEEMAAQKALFIQRAGDKQIPVHKAEKIFDLMEYFAGYGFNKSHSAAYALITYQTAYLKYHHPTAFMAALLSSEMGNSDKVVKYIGTCRKMNIRMLPPDVNESARDFTVTPDGIRFGLAAIKNVGGAAIDAILTARDTGGPFVSLFDFCARIDLRRANKRVLESLIHCGAFDSTGAKRAVLMEVLEPAVAFGGRKKEEKGAMLQMSIFGDSLSEIAPPLPDLPEWEDDRIAALEKETVGFFVTRHPLTRYSAVMKLQGATPTEALAAAEDNQSVKVCGLIVQEKVTTTRKGDKMAYLRLEDLTGSVEVIVFPDLFASAALLLRQGVPLMIAGTLDRGEAGVKLKATEVIPLRVPEGLEPGPADGSPGDSSTLRAPILRGAPAVPEAVVITLFAEAWMSSDLQALKRELEKYPGDDPLQIRIHVAGGAETRIAADTALRVDGSEPMRRAILARFGRGIQIEVPQS
jgi:DNA polymerase-3 subunit alpha